MEFNYTLNRRCNYHCAGFTTNLSTSLIAEVVNDDFTFSLYSLRLALNECPNFARGFFLVKLGVILYSLHDAII